MEQLYPILVKSPKYLITFSVSEVFTRDNGTIPDVVNRTHDDSRFDMFTPNVVRDVLRKLKPTIRLLVLMVFLM